MTAPSATMYPGKRVHWLGFWWLRRTSCGIDVSKDAQGVSRTVDNRRQFRKAYRPPVNETRVIDLVTCRGCLRSLVKTETERIERKAQWLEQDRASLARLQERLRAP